MFWLGYDGDVHRLGRLLDTATESFFIKVTSPVDFTDAPCRWALGYVEGKMKVANRSQLVSRVNLLTPTGHVMHQQFNIQQLYVLPTLYLCVLYLSENKQRLVPIAA